MKTLASLIFFTLLILNPLAKSKGDFFTQINLGDYNYDYIANTPGNIFLGAHAQYPTGAVALGNVPFAIPSTGNNIWSAHIDTDKMLNITNLSINNASQVHMLVNTFWGTTDQTRGATVKVYGSGGAVSEAILVGNSHMRDYLNGSYTNSINNTTTKEVFTAGTGGAAVRLDKFQFDLPAAFQTQQLTRIELVDNGGTSVSRVFTAGITVQSVPEPSSVCLLGLGMLSFIGLRSKRRCR